jgi:hypothetical protein
MTICGASGAGKTTTMRCLHETYPGPSIMFNLDHEPDFGTTVRDVDGLANALQEGHTEIDVRPPETVIREPDLFPGVVEFLIKFGNALRSVGNGQVQFLMDECQDLQDEWVQVSMKRLRKRRIKPIAATQDPVSMSKRTRTIADYNSWLSPPADDMKDFLKTSRYPLPLLEDLPHYDMLVLGEGWEPVARFRAPEEFTA